MFAVDLTSSTCGACDVPWREKTQLRQEHYRDLNGLSDRILTVQTSPIVFWKNEKSQISVIFHIFCVFCFWKIFRRDFEILNVFENAYFGVQILISLSTKVFVKFVANCSLRQIKVFLYPDHGCKTHRSFLKKIQKMFFFLFVKWKTDKLWYTTFTIF